MSLALNGQDGNGWQLDKLGQLFQVDQKLITENNLLCLQCKYRRLKKRTHLFDHMTINDSEWIRSNDDLLMWERNLRASEVKTNNGVSNRPLNEKRS